MSQESYFSPYNCLQGLLLQIRSKLNFYDPSQSLIRSSFETRSRNSAQCESGCTVALAYFLLGGVPQEDVEVSLAYSYLCQIKVVSKVKHITS